MIVPPAFVAVIVSGKIPTCVGEPLKATLPLPLWVATMPCGKPMTTMLLGGLDPETMMFALYGAPNTPTGSVLLISTGCATAWWLPINSQQSAWTTQPSE